MTIVFVLAIYYIIGVWSCIDDWREHSDVELPAFLMIVIVGWIIGPFLLTKRIRMPVIFRKK